MNGKALARTAAVILLAAAIAMATLELRRTAEPAVPDPVNVTGRDPLATLLRRCRAMGEQAASSGPCLRAWAENRCRFFGGARGDARCANGKLGPSGPASNDSAALGGT